MERPGIEQLARAGEDTMNGSRSLFTAVAAATAFAAGLYAGAAPAQSTVTTPPPDLHPPAKLDADTWRSQLTPSYLGLKPKSNATTGIDLPAGLSYSRETRGLAIPLDDKSDGWRVGVGLNLNQSNAVELSPSSSVGLQAPLPRTPGVMFQKKF